MDYYIFRHGETFETKNNILYGDRVYKAEILSEGMPAIKRIGEHLTKIKTDNNFSSPFLRCKQTVGIITDITDKNFLFDNRLGEYIENNESFDQMAKRIQSFLKVMADENHKTIALCTHGGIIAGLKHLIINGEYLEPQLMDFPKPGVLIEIKDGKLKHFNFN